MQVAGPVQSGDTVVRSNEASPGITALLAKESRKQRGIFQLPPTQEPQKDFYNMALDNVQNQLRGAAQTVNAMAPEGESLAYINPQEAGILKLLGGSGEPQPVTGIPSFRPPGRGGASDRNPGFTGSYSRPKPSGGGGGGGNKNKVNTSVLKDLEDAMAAKEKETGVKMAPRITEPSTPKQDKDNKKEKSFLEKLFGGNDEVKAIQATVDAKIEEVKNDPNLSNFQKNELIKQLKFAKSPEGRQTGYSMGELSKMIMSGVDQKRLGSIRLGGNDAKQLLNAGVISQENYDEALGLIEKYGRGVVFDPVNKVLRTAPPTGKEFVGDVARGAGSMLENLPFMKIIKSLGGGEELEKQPSESESEFQDRVNAILSGSGSADGLGMSPGASQAMYGPMKARTTVVDPGVYDTATGKLIGRKVRLDGIDNNYAGLNQSFFDPATQGIGFNLNTGEFGKGATIGKAALTPQVAGAIDRVMNPKKGGGGGDIGMPMPDGGDLKPKPEKDLPYFSYRRKIEQPMDYDSIIARAYKGSDGPLLQNFQEALEEAREEEMQNIGLFG